VQGRRDSAESSKAVQGNLRRLFYRRMLGGMRYLAILLLLAAGLASGQEAEDSAAGQCNVVTRPPEVNAAGEFARPPPTDEECELAGSLEAKFLATPGGNFRQVRNLTQLPESLRRFVDGIGGASEVRNPVSVTVQVGRYPQSQQQRFAVWLGTELVVIAYRVTGDVSGNSTNVVLADLNSLTACTYMRWRGGEMPSTMRIRDIQRALDKGLLGDRETPTCHLRQIPLD